MSRLVRTPPKTADAVNLVHVQSEPDMQRALQGSPDTSNVSLRQKRPRMDLSPDTVDTEHVNIVTENVPEVRSKPSAETETSLLLSEIRLLRQQVYDLKKQNTDIGLKLTNVSEAINQKLEEFNGKIEARDKEIVLLKSSITELQHKLHIYEQSNIRNELEIIGIEEENNENLVHITMLTAKKIGFHLSEADIDEAYRAGPRRTNLTGKPRSIVLRLTRRATRTQILKAAKDRRPLTSDDIIKGTSNKVYINERLTATNRLLFREARTRAQAHGFRYCWVRNGTINIRKAENQPSIPIRTTTDLDEKIGPFQAMDAADPDHGMSLAQALEDQ